MKTGRGNRSTRRKPTPAPLCPPQNPIWQTWSRTPDRSGGKLSQSLSQSLFLLPVLYSSFSCTSRVAVSQCRPAPGVLHSTLVLVSLRHINTVSLWYMRRPNSIISPLTSAFLAVCRGWLLTITNKCYSFIRTSNRTALFASRHNQRNWNHASSTCCSITKARLRMHATLSNRTDYIRDYQQTQLDIRPTMDTKTRIKTSLLGYDVSEERAAFNFRIYKWIWW
jgi:hypothetical protein